MEKREKILFFFSFVWSESVSIFPSDFKQSTQTAHVCDGCSSDKKYLTRLRPCELNAIGIVICEQIIDKRFREEEETHSNSRTNANENEKNPSSMRSIHFIYQWMSERVRVNQLACYYLVCHLENSIMEHARALARSLTLNKNYKFLCLGSIAWCRTLLDMQRNEMCLVAKSRHTHTHTGNVCRFTVAAADGNHI